MLWIMLLGFWCRIVILKMKGNSCVKRSFWACPQKLPFQYTKNYNEALSAIGDFHLCVVILLLIQGVMLQWVHCVCCPLRSLQYTFWPLILFQTNLNRLQSPVARFVSYYNLVSWLGTQCSKLYCSQILVPNLKYQHSRFQWTSDNLRLLQT